MTYQGWWLTLESQANKSSRPEKGKWERRTLHIHSDKMRARSLGAPIVGLAVLAGALAGCGGAAPSSSGTVVKPTVKTTIYTPAAKGDLSTVNWNISEGEPNPINPFQSSDYPPN